MSDYAELLDDLDAWATVQPAAAKAIRELVRERDAMAQQVDAVLADIGRLTGERDQAWSERDEARALLELIAENVEADGSPYGVRIETIKRLLAGGRSDG